MDDLDFESDLSELVCVNKVGKQAVLQLSARSRLQGAATRAARGERRAASGRRRAAPRAARFAHLHPLQGLADLAPLSGALSTSLTHLNLSCNRLTSLRPLRGLTALRRLNVQRNRLPGLDDLEALTALERLDAGSNAIASLRPLTRLAGLRELLLHRNAVADPAELAAALASLARLEKLAVYGNPAVAAAGGGARAVTLATLGGGLKVGRAAPPRESLAGTAGAAARFSLGYERVRLWWEPTYVRPAACPWGGLGTPEGARTRPQILDCTAVTAEELAAASGQPTWADISRDAAATRAAGPATSQGPQAVPGSRGQAGVQTMAEAPASVQVRPRTRAKVVTVPFGAWELGYKDCCAAAYATGRLHDHPAPPAPRTPLPTRAPCSCCRSSACHPGRAPCSETARQTLPRPCARSRPRPATATGEPLVRGCAPLIEGGGADARVSCLFGSGACALAVCGQHVCQHPPLTLGRASLLPQAPQRPAVRDAAAQCHGLRQLAVGAPRSVGRPGPGGRLPAAGTLRRPGLRALRSRQRGWGGRLCVLPGRADRGVVEARRRRRPLRERRGAAGAVERPQASWGRFGAAHSRRMP
jgi:hypothetical protein